MRVGMLGMGRMGSAMAQRLLRAGHGVVVHDLVEAACLEAERAGAVLTRTTRELVLALEPPRVVWLMLPAAVVQGALEALVPLLAPGDVVIDGGNSFFGDDLRRARALDERGLGFVDVGVSGGVIGAGRGYCLMIGGPAEVVETLVPVFAALAPGALAAPPTPGRARRPGTAEQGYLHCGPTGAGHFVKMVHNAIEYGMMAAYAEGLSILRHADAGARPRGRDAETAPLRDPDLFRYDFDLADVAQLWRRGSIIGSWLLDRVAEVLALDPALQGFAGRVSDSGEGRWAIEESVPATALFERVASRGHGEFAAKVMSALRQTLGGHEESAA